MKLVFPFRPQQLLFVPFTALFLLLATEARAQVDAVIVMKPTAQAPQGTTMQTKVSGVTGTSLMVREQFGERGISLATIQSVQMAAPPEVAVAQQAFEAKDLSRAMASAQAVVMKWRGLPTPWAINSSALIGDIYLAQNDVAKAEAAYGEFAKQYPGHGGADLGRARVAVAKKDFESAKRVVEPLTAKALQDKNPSPQLSQIYGQAYLVLGQIKEGDGNYAGALEDYLRTVTLFYLDRTIVAQAQEKADALRKAHGTFVP